MAKEFSILLVGENRDLSNLLDEIRKIKYLPVRLELVSLAHTKETVEKIHPHLVIFDMNGNVDSVRKTATVLGEDCREVSWAVSSKENDPDLILEFFRLGAADFLKAPVGSEDVKRLIRKVVQFEESRELNPKDEFHRTLCFFSPKGGTGVSFLATNLAVELAKKKTGNVLLLDLVLEHGNVADLLDMPSQYTLTDVVENFERLDANLLQNSIEKHKSGLFVLPCPKQPEEEEELTPQLAEEIFRFFKNTFQYVIADVGHEFSRTALSFMDSCDQIFLVGTPDVPSLYNVRRALGTFQRLSYPSEKIKLILNRWKMKGAIDPLIIQKNLGLHFSSWIPDDPASAMASVNEGKTLFEVSKSGELVKSMNKLILFASELPKKGTAAHVAA